MTTREGEDREIVNFIRRMSVLFVGYKAVAYSPLQWLSLCAL
jgi:hypothetical protein